VPHLLIPPLFGICCFRLERRLSFKSEFDVRCELIDYDNDSRRSLRTSIIRRKDQLQGLCEEGRQFLTDANILKNPDTNYNICSIETSIYILEITCTLFEGCVLNKFCFTWSIVQTYLELIWDF